MLRSHPCLIAYHYNTLSRCRGAQGSTYVIAWHIASLKPYQVVSMASACRCRTTNCSHLFKNKANLGNDWGRSHESILHFRKSSHFTFNIDDIRIPYGNHTLKYPEHPQAETSQYGQGRDRNHMWQPHPKGAKPRDVLEIPTTCNGMHEKTPHPTQKPEELLRKLILASSSPGDMVIDPFLGSGTTAVTCEQLGRRWHGCDTNLEYCQWAAERIEAVVHRSPEFWVGHDVKNAERRKSIRL